MLLPLLRAVVAIANLCLIAATRDLWFGDSGFPMIPFIRGLSDVPLWIDSVLSTLLVGSLLLLAGVSVRDVVRVRRSPVGDPASRTARLRLVRLTCALTVLSGAALALLNQHRLQPWLYHLVLLCPILALDERRFSSQAAMPSSWGSSQPPGGQGWNEAHSTGDFLRRLSPAPVTQLVVLLTASIYFWSGTSKCDRAFIDGHGQTFVTAIADVLGLSLKFWSPTMRSTAAALLPLGELLVAIGLFVPKSRRLALFVSLLMHGLLITAVGPWGMDQRPGVLIWNVLFISQNVLLLRWLSLRRIRAGAASVPGSANESKESRTGAACGTQLQSPTGRVPSPRSLQFARCVVIVASIAPVLRFAGWFDNWPAWAVYTAGNERAYVLIAEDAIDRLPPNIRRFVQPRAMNDGWSWLRIDLWSIAAVDAPLYPQKRFTVACGLAIAQQPGMQDSVRLLSESAANSLTGKRTTESHVGRAALQELASQFTLDVQIRPTAR